MLKEFFYIKDAEFVPRDKWVRIIGIPLLGILIPLFVNVKEPGAKNIFYSIFICVFFTFLHWEGNRFIIVKLRALHPEYSATSKRIILQLLCSLSYTLFVNIAICYLITGLILRIPFHFDYVVVNLKISIVATAFIAALYECFYIFKRWEKAIIESEQLKRENLISQFETLKNQVNPHFLFNSLNTLSAIIPENSTLAVDFVQKLSNVYRYVLQNKDKEVVDLSVEVEFLKDYVFLNKIRFGDNLNVAFVIDEEKLNSKVAPLTLQMLIENAIKHNVVSAEKPLFIKVYIEKENILVIENNLQKKSTPVESTQTGLQNIINRYKYLSEKVVEILITASAFKVSLPLLTLEKNDGINN